MVLKSSKPRPIWAFDTAVAVIVGAVALIALATISPDEQRLFSRSPDALAVILALAQALPIALRRIYPVPVLVFTVAAFIIDRTLDYPGSTASIAIAFAFHSLGSELPRRRSLQIGLPIIALLLAFTISGVYAADSVSWGTVVVLLIATLAPLLLGREVNERRRYLTALEEHAEQLERDREARARRAVREERARIARELHDVVAHEMTVMTVQAAAAKRVLGREPDAVAEALDAIESAGHDALTEMRRLLGLLRDEEGRTEFMPQPGLDLLGGLREQMEEAGLPVRLVTEGDPVALPAGVDLNAYRIVQESLTNSLRHGGPGTAAEVRLAYEPDRLIVTVTDDGRGAAEALASPTDGGGHGLVGMKERITLLGGDLSAGPRKGGGYQVTATIPTVMS